MRSQETFASEEQFSMDLPDLQALIKKLNLLDENVNLAVRKSLRSGADIIMKEQKRLISDKSKRLSDAISKSQVYVNKKGELGITTGYQSGAFKTDNTGFNPGIVGMTYEFGRPGQSAQRSGEKMEQVRRIIPNRKKGVRRKDWGEAVPTKIMVKKGRIQSHPHIRKGFDNKLSEAVQVVVSAVENEVKKAGNES